MANRLDDAIEIPEVLHFACNDRTQLLDQLKVLQMVLRKERDKNEDISLPMTSNSSSKSYSRSTTASDIKTELTEKVDKHKKMTEQRRQDKLEQMDTEARALLKAMNKEEDTSSESIKVNEQGSASKPKIVKNCNIYTYLLQVKKRHQEPSTSSNSVTKRIKQMCIENSNQEKQQSLSNTQSSCQSTSQSTSQGGAASNERDKSSAATETSIMDMYRACDSEKSRREMRQKAIQMMRRSGYAVSVVEPGEFAVKYALSAPYHLFFTRVEKSKETYDQRFSITFPEILDRSVGEIVESLHLNFMVDVGWLCLQYLLAGQCTDMMIFYGDRVDQEKLGNNITTIHVDMPSRYGCHHTKIMILQYKDNGIRVVVSTANLYSDDWENRTQGSVEHFEIVLADVCLLSICVGKCIFISCSDCGSRLIFPRYQNRRIPTTGSPRLALRRISSDISANTDILL